MGVTNGIQPSLKKFPSFRHARAPKVIRAPDRDRIICTRSSLLSLAEISTPWNTCLKENQLEARDWLVLPVKAELQGHYKLCAMSVGEDSQVAIPPP